MTSGLLATVELAMKDFDSFTKTWQAASQPNFNIRVKVSKKMGEASITTSDRPFLWVALGTKKRHFALFMMDGSPYIRKTKPGSIRSWPRGNYYKTPLRFPKKGIKARNPHVLIANRVAKKFRKIIGDNVVVATGTFFK